MSRLRPLAALLLAGLLGGLSVEDLREPVAGSLRQRCRNSKLCQATGWRPRVNLHDGLARTIAWHERQAALAAALRAALRAAQSKRSELFK